MHTRILEGDKERIQIFSGTVIGTSGTGARSMFTVRRIVAGEGVERKFPVHSPKIAKIEVKRSGVVRRAKLYYLRDRVGKAARVAERRWGIDDGVLGTEEDAAVDAEGTTQGEAPQAVPTEGEDGEETVREVEQGAEPATEHAEEAGEPGDGESGDDGDEAAEADASGGSEASAGDEADESGDEGEEQDAATETEPAGEPEGGAASASDALIFPLMISCKCGSASRWAPVRR